MISEQKKNLNNEIDKENFNSDFYFDDIIKELGDAGFDVEAGVEKKKSIYQNYDAEKSLSPDEINNRLNDLDNRIKSISSSFDNGLKQISSEIAKERVIQQKILKSVINNFLLLKNDTEENFRTLNEMFSKKVAEDVTKDKAFEELYSQLDSYKNNFVSKAISPFLHDLMLYYDRLTSNLDFHDTSSGNDNVQDRDSFINTLKMFREELLEILSRNGVEKLDRSSEESIFNPEKSNVVEKSFTDNKDLDMKVKSVIKEGFTHDNKIIRPETVVIYKYKEQRL